MEFEFSVDCNDEMTGHFLNITFTTESEHVYRVFTRTSFYEVNYGEVLSIPYETNESVRITVFNGNGRARIVNAVAWNCDQEDYFLIRETTECLDNYDYAMHYRLFKSLGSDVSNLNLGDFFNEDLTDVYTSIHIDNSWGGDPDSVSPPQISFLDDPGEWAVLVNHGSPGECCQCTWSSPDWQLPTSTFFNGSRIYLYEVDKPPYENDNAFLQSPFTVMDIYDFVDFSKNYEFVRYNYFDIEDEIPFQNICFQQTTPIPLDFNWLEESLCESHPEFSFVENSAYVNCNYNVNYQLNVNTDFDISDQYFLLYSIGGEVQDTIEALSFSPDIVPEGLFELVLVQDLYMTKSNEQGFEEVIADCEIRSFPKDIYKITSAPELSFLGYTEDNDELSCCYNQGDYVDLIFEYSNLVQGSWYYILIVQDQDYIIKSSSLLGSNSEGIKTIGYDRFGSNEFTDVEAYLFQRAHIGSIDNFSEVYNTNCDLVSEPVKIYLDSCEEPIQGGLTTACFEDTALLEKPFASELFEDQHIFYQVCKWSSNCRTYYSNEIVFDSSYMDLGELYDIYYIVGSDANQDSIPDENIQCSIRDKYAELVWNDCITTTCPVGSYNGEVEICSGGSLTLPDQSELGIDDPENAIVPGSFGWFNFGDDPETSIPIFGAIEYESNLNCTPLFFNYSAYVLCDQNSTVSFELVGTQVVTVYPEADYSYTLDEESVCPILCVEPVCENHVVFLNGVLTYCFEFQPGGFPPSVVVDVTHDTNSSMNCVTAADEVFVNCEPCPVCSTDPGICEWIQDFEFCSNDAGMVNNLPLLDVNFFIPSTSNPASIGFYLDEGGTFEYIPGELSPEGCEAINIEVFILIECEGSLTPTGASFFVTIFPDPADNDFTLELSEDNCTVQFTSECENYLIENSAGGNDIFIAQQGDIGDIAFTVSDTLNPLCSPNTIVSSFNCIGTGIEEIETTFNWLQVGNEIRIELPSDLSEPLNTRLSDLSGRLISRTQFTNSPYRVSTEGIPEGIYVLSIETEIHILAQKVFVK